MSRKLILAIILLSLAGCSSSYQSVMEELKVKHDEPQEMFDILKEMEFEDQEDVIKLHATLTYLSLKIPSVSVEQESKMLLNKVKESSIELDAIDHVVQSMIYLVALADGDNTYNNRIDVRVKSTIDELCLPPNLGYRMDDIEKLNSVYYKHHIAEACQAIFHDSSADSNIAHAVLLGRESCTFKAQTAKGFFSELLECRLQRNGVDLTGLLPNNSKEVE